jgi:hypothetical protein
MKKDEKRKLKWKEGSIFFFFLLLLLLLAFLLELWGVGGGL